MPVSIVTAGSTGLDEVGGLLVTTLEDCYNALREKHPEVPAAVIVISSRPPTKTRQVWGHFAQSRWFVNGTQLPEIMISAEGLKRPPRDVLATLVHEAAHGLCSTRKVRDTSDSGRYHNEDFKRVAEELGMVAERVPRGGWTQTTLPQGKWDNLVGELTRDLIGYRQTEIKFSQTSNSGGRNEFSYRCACPRKVRVYEGVYDAGPILCGVCGDEFQ